MVVPERLHEPDDSSGPTLPVRTAEALRTLARPPRDLPALVDARLRAGIEQAFERQARRRSRRRWPAARWLTAATVAIAAGGWLGWRAPSVAVNVVSPEHVQRTATRPFTIVDALLAARLARHDGSAHNPIDAALLARLDVDGDGKVTADDAAILARRAVERRTEAPS